MPMTWYLKPGVTPEMLGYIPQFLREDDPRPAREQFHENYGQGGGWNPFQGFSLLQPEGTLHYPGDPPIEWLAQTRLRDELIRYYQHSWVVIMQPDGTWEVSRMD